MALDDDDDILARSEWGAIKEKNCFALKCMKNCNNNYSVAVTCLFRSENLCIIIDCAADAAADLFRPAKIDQRAVGDTIMMLTHSSNCMKSLLLYNNSK